MEDSRAAGVRVLVRRGGRLESEHRVRVAVWREGRLAAAAGDVEEPVFLRSAAKFVQATAAVTSGAADRFDLSDAELAVACASHNGEPFHVSTVAGMLDRLGLGPEALLCGAHPPMHDPSVLALAAAGERPGVLHNNCSGKHTAMLAACLAMGWEPGDYVDPDHPLQGLNRRNVESLAEVPSAGVHVGVDGCSAPTFHLPLAGVARMFARFTSAGGDAGVPDDLAAAADRLLDAMTAHPEMVAGTGRLDTDLIAATGGRVVSKVGAEGLWGVGVRGRSLGVVVSCADGNTRGSYRVGLAVLRSLGELSDAEWEALAPHHDRTRRNHRGIEVGDMAIEPPEGVFWQEGDLT